MFVRKLKHSNGKIYIQVVFKDKRKYKVYKELERQLKEKKSNLSPEKVIEILQSIYQIEITVPQNSKKIRKTLILTQEHQLIAKTFDFGC